MAGPIGHYELFKVIEGTGFCATGPSGSNLTLIRTTTGERSEVGVSDMVPAESHVEWPKLEALISGFGGQRSAEMRSTELAGTKRPRACQVRITVEVVPLSEEMTEELLGRARARVEREEKEDGWAELRKLVARAEETVENDTLDWEGKFNIVFAGAPRVRELMSELGLGRLDYYDPDASYEEDVRAYMRALREQLKPLL